VLRELAALREEASRLAARLAALRAADALGTPLEGTLPQLVREHRLATSADGVAQAREALQNAKAEDPVRPGRVARLTALRDFLVEARAIALEPGAAQELFELPRRKLVRPPGDAGLHGALPPIAVERRLPYERDRDKRAELEAALSDALGQYDGVRGAVFETRQAALAEAGIAPEASALAEQVLDGTDAIARDLGAWLLERNTSAKNGFARHDVLHLLHAPRCAPAFPRGELVRTVRRWAEMFRFDLLAQKAIRLDDEDRPLKRAGAFALPVEAPYETVVSLLPEEGPRALGSLLFALGEAQRWAGPSSDAPPEDVWLGDPAVRIACGALFEGLLREREFLRRCAKVELPRDDERAIAMAAVFDLRMCAARAIASAQARELGPGARAANAHRELFARAALAELPAGLALDGIDAFPRALDELRGRMLAAGMRAFLRERYDEDFWRNPRALASLQPVWARGGRLTADDVWRECAQSPGFEPLRVELLDACQ
jgi:hypothetical protein